MIGRPLPPLVLHLPDSPPIDPGLLASSWSKVGRHANVYLVFGRSFAESTQSRRKDWPGARDPVKHMRYSATPRQRGAPAPPTRRKRTKSDCDVSLRTPILQSDFTPIHAVSASALDECTSSALEQLADGFTNLGILYTPSCVGHAWKSTIAGLFRCRNYYLIGIGIHHEIGIMRHHNDLSPPLRTAEVGH